jgi:hypothetical protein
MIDLTTLYIYKAYLDEYGKYLCYGSWNVMFVSHVFIFRTGGHQLMHTVDFIILFNKGLIKPQSHHTTPTFDNDHVFIFRTGGHQSMHTVVFIILFNKGLIKPQSHHTTPTFDNERKTCQRP